MLSQMKTSLVNWHWGLPNMGFPPFYVIPSKNVFSQLIPIPPHEEWGVCKHEVLCADLEISSTFHQSIFL